eukprot:768681-Hanusia_phi.AAC.18
MFRVVSEALFIHASLMHSLSFSTIKHLACPCSPRPPSPLRLHLPTALQELDCISGLLTRTISAQTGGGRVEG